MPNGTGFGHFFSLVILIFATASWGDLKAPPTSRGDCGGLCGWKNHHQNMGSSNRGEFDSFVSARLDSPKTGGDCGGLCGFNEMETIPTGTPTEILPVEAPGMSLRSIVLPSGDILQVELAKTPMTRKKGLMFRKRLPPNQGMLFIYPEPGPYRIWMKNCFIPLDILWLNEEKEIIEVTRNAPPCQRDPCPVYGKNREALYVLELNAGAAQRFNLHVGEKIKF